MPAQIIRGRLRGPLYEPAVNLWGAKWWPKVPPTFAASHFYGPYREASHFHRNPSRFFFFPKPVTKVRKLIGGSPPPPHDPPGWAQQSPAAAMDGGTYLNSGPARPNPKNCLTAGHHDRPREPLALHGQDARPGDEQPRPSPQGRVEHAAPIGKEVQCPWLNRAEGPVSPDRLLPLVPEMSPSRPKMPSYLPIALCLALPGSRLWNGRKFIIWPGHPWPLVSPESFFCKDRPFLDGSLRPGCLADRLGAL